MAYNVVDKLFEGTPSASEQLVYLSWLQEFVSKDETARKAAQRLVDWYHRDTDRIRDHIKTTGAKTFPDGSLDEWLLPIINGVPRIIRRLSLAYKAPPLRRYTKGGKTLEGEALLPIQRMYKNVRQNRKMKELDRWSTLHNTCHAEIVVRNGAIDWDVLLRPAVTVIEDPNNYLDFVRLVYVWNPMNPNDLRVTEGLVVWDEDRYEFITSRGERFGMANEDRSNPYSPVIPIVTVRKIEMDDYWGRLGADLVDGFEQASLQIANTWENAILQTYGQPLATNCGFKKGEQVKIGTRHPIAVDGVTKEDVPPSLEFPKPDPDLESVRGVVDWFVGLLTTSYGMPPNAWSLDEVPESGFAKFMSNLELLEDRDDQLSNWADIERDLFEKSRIVHNAHASEFGEPEVPMDIELEIEFPPVSFPESPLEKQTRYSLMFKNKLSDPVDYFMREEGLDEETAMLKAKEIKGRWKELGSSEEMPPLPDLNKPSDKDQDGDDEESTE